jgi:hypothetical protein
MSKSVYIFQRIWSAGVVTERTAWELLSLVDQIHLWGVTDHRDFVIQHLKPWHEYAETCYARNADWTLADERLGRRIDPETGLDRWVLPADIAQLPAWARHLTGDFSARKNHLIERVK